MDYSKKTKEELIKEIESFKNNNDLESLKSYKNLFDNSPNLIYIQTKEGQFINVNKTVVEKYGYKKEEIIGKYPDFLAGPGNDIPKISAFINEAWDGKQQTFEFIAKTKKGEIFIKKVTTQKGYYFGEKVIISSAIDITEKKSIENHLKENEEKYRNLFSNNLAGVFITENGVIIECNNSFAKIYGYKSRVEIIGKKAEELYFDIKDRKKYIDDLKNKKVLSNYIIRNKKNDGSEVWVSTNTSIFFLNNNIIRTEGTLVDLTKEVKIEKELIESKKSYQELTENSPYGIIVHLDGKILYTNKKAKSILNVSNNDILKHSFYDFILPENIKEIKERNKKALKGENIPFKEFIVKSEKKLIHLKGKPSVFHYGNKKAIQVVFTDIALEKELYKEKLRATIAEESNIKLQNEINIRKKIENQLVENQKYTKSYIANSLDIICAADKTGKIIEFNAAAEKTFGYSLEEIKKENTKIFYAKKSDYKKVYDALKTDKSFIGEIINIRKNGEIFTSFLTATILYNDTGEEIGSMGVSRNITELKEAEQQLKESEEKYRDILENATDLIQSLDNDGNILYVNNAWKKKLGYTSDEVINKNIFEIIHPDCLEKCKNIFKEIKKSKEGESRVISIELKSKKGKKIIAEGSVGVKFKKNKLVSTRSILRDVTTEKGEETKQNIYNNISKIVVEKQTPTQVYEGIRQELGKIMNTESFIISYSLNETTLTFPYYYDNIKSNGIINKENRIKGSGINEYFLKKSKIELLKREELDQIIKEGGYKISGKKCKAFLGVPLKIKNETVGVLSLQSYKNKDEFNTKSIEILDFISGIIALTVQRKQDENKIEEQSAKIKSIIENSTHLFWTFDKVRGVTSSNKNFDKYIKSSYNINVNLKKNLKNKVRFSDKEHHDFWDRKYNDVFNGKTQTFIYKKESIKGKISIKEVFLSPIYNNEGIIVEVSGIAHDITEKILSEQKLKESLQEKEVLLKEVHHRVKNNLQVISSILNLQSSYVKDKKTLDILRESQNRIKSMSFIHESLYQNTDFSEINFSEYIVSLSKNLVHSYGIYDNLIDLRLSVGDISLNLDLSIPCGLIINELVSNALKYAFNETKKGEIKIKLLEKKGQIHLTVQDNGVGLPKSLDYKNTDSLGLQLVTTLVEQINGKIELENKKGVKFTIIFKKEQ